MSPTERKEREQLQGMLFLACSLIIEVQKGRYATHFVDVDHIQYTLLRTFKKCGTLEGKKRPKFH